MRSLLVAMIIFASVPVILLKPYVGVLMWSWISYMNPHRLTWGFAYSFPFAMLVGGATLAAWFLSRDKKEFPVTATTVILMTYTVWVSLGTLGAMIPDLAYEKWLKLIKILVITYVTMMLINTRRKIDLLVWVIAGSIAYFGVKGGVFTVLKGGQHRIFGPPNSFIGENNALALAEIMVIPLLRYIQLQLTRRIFKWAMGGAMLMMVFAVLASYSRGAFIAMSVMLFAIWVKSRKRALLGVLGAISIAAALAFMPAKYFERINTLQTYEEDASALGRIDAWLMAFNLAKAKPLFGGGFDVFESTDIFLTYNPDAPRARQAHSIYFEVLGEHGFVGLALFLALGFAALRTCSSTIALAKRNPEFTWARDLAAMIQVSLLGFAAGGAFLSLASFDLYYHLIAIAVVTKIVVQGSLKAEAPWSMHGRSAASHAPAAASNRGGVPG